MILNARETILANQDEFNSELYNRRDELIKQESRLAQAFGLKEKDVEWLFEEYQAVSEQTQDFVSTAEMLKDYHIILHKSIREMVASIRELPRKKKKKRKNSLSQGITSAVFGTVVIAANTQLPLVFAFSYGLGGGALHQAIRDIVGTETN
jgi:Fe2+ transport system protein B